MRRFTLFILAVAFSAAVTMGQPVSKVSAPPEPLAPPTAVTAIINTEAVATTPQQEGLTNEDIIKMAKAGMSEKIILNMIATQATNFQISPDRVLEMRKAGVSDNILAAMIMGQSKSPAPSLGTATTIVPRNISVSNKATGSMVKVQDGTLAHLVLMDTISSGTNKQNEPVKFELAEDVKSGDTVLIPKGSKAIGRIVVSQSAGRMAKSGKLEFTIEYLKAPDDTNIRLRANAGAGDPNIFNVKSVIFGAASIFMKGKEITYEKGTPIDAYVDGDKEILATR